MNEGSAGRDLCDDASDSSRVLAYAASGEAATVVAAYAFRIDDCPVALKVGATWRGTARLLKCVRFKQAMLVEGAVAAVALLVGMCVCSGT